MSAGRFESSRRDFLRLTAAGAGALALSACGGGSSSVSSSGKISTSGKVSGNIRALFMKQAAYSTGDVNNMTKQFMAKYPGVHVTADFVAYEALHDKIVTAAPAGTYDVVLIDVIWPAEFASKHLIRDITDELPQSQRSQIFPGALQSAQYQGRYYGVPWILDTEYLFYNKKMFQKAGISGPPKTWTDVVSAARALKQKNIVKYPFIWKAAQEEEIVCDYGAVFGAYGGTWLKNGQPAFNTGGGVQALSFMRSMMAEGLADPASLNSTGDDCRKAVSQGSSAMCLNWTYMYALANDPKQSNVAGQIDIAHTPAGPSGDPGINGSMALSVTSTSKNPSAALKYVEYLTSQPVQDKYAQLSLPIWKSSYTSSANLDAAKPVVAVAKTQLGNMLLRPQVPQYNAVSHSLMAELQNGLSGRKTPQQALDDAAAAAKNIMST